MSHETIFTVESTPLKYGPGASAEAGWEARRLGIRRAAVFVDPHIRREGIADRVLEQLQAEGIEVGIYDDIRVEPDAESFERAVAWTQDGGFDGFVSMGGGSTIDTAKVSNLIATHGGAVMDYVNPPVGGGQKPPSELKPHLAIPTTSGSGSEATTVAILDIPEAGVKSGISHRFMRPTQAIVDPELTRTLPGAVVASAGLDVVCHAVESFTARWFETRDAPAGPGERPPYQGANPVAELWAGKALELGGRYLRRAAADGDDVEARGNLMLSASLAGIGFGSAGVHIPHACAYGIATGPGAKQYTPPGYDADHPFVPHGYSVIVTSPAAFRFTYEADPERHHRAAELLSDGQVKASEADRETLPRVLAELMRDVGAPSGLTELGYGEEHVPELVQGALKQRRLLDVAPREAGPDDLAGVLRESFTNW